MTTLNKIKDISLADWGRKEIEMAEVQMPGLISCREEFGQAKPFKGARISGSLHMTIQTAVLIETLQALGAEVRWCSCNIYSTQDQAAAAIAQAGTAKVFAWKGQTLQEYWNLTLDCISWENGQGPNLIVDDGGDATLLILLGVEAERKLNGATTLEDIQKVLGVPDKEKLSEDEYWLNVTIQSALSKDNQFFTKVSKDLIGISEETTTGVNRLYKLESEGRLPFPAINVNDSVTKSKFDNIYGCKHSLPDGIYRATDVMLAGKKVMIFGYGDVGKGCTSAMKAAGARVYVSEVDPICALQACMQGYEVVKKENVIKNIDVFITATGNKDIISAADMALMKNNAIVGNIGHFDNEIEMDGLKKVATRINIKPQVDRYVFPDGHGVIVLSEGRLLNLGNATGHPSFVMSNSFTNQVLAQLELWNNKGTTTYANKVYKLPRHLDEKVARLHLKSLGAELTVLSSEQAEYIGVKVEGPFKKDDYKY